MSLVVTISEMKFPLVVIHLTVVVSIVGTELRMCKDSVRMRDAMTVRCNDARDASLSPTANLPSAPYSHIVRQINCCQQRSEVEW